jgi:outer membrane autotransporter protein
VARSDVSSTFISPSLTLDAAYKATDRIELRPSVSVNYSIAWMDDYKEKGTTRSNLTVDDRTVEVLTARIQLAAALQLNNAAEFEVRAGVSTRNSDSDDVDASIGGNAFSYSHAGDENVSGRFAGANLRIAAQDNLNLVIDMEFGGDSDEDYVNGNISLEYVF